MLIAILCWLYAALQKRDDIFIFRITQSQLNWFWRFLVSRISKPFDMIDYKFVHHTWKMSLHYLVKCRPLSPDRSPIWSPSKTHWPYCNLCIELSQTDYATRCLSRHLAWSHFRPALHCCIRKFKYLQKVIPPVSFSNTLHLHNVAMGRRSSQMLST